MIAWYNQIILFVYHAERVLRKQTAAAYVSNKNIYLYIIIIKLNIPYIPIPINVK